MFFGTLTQFMGLRKINTIGIKQANKVMHLSAVAYNLKKYLKFIAKHVKSEAGSQFFTFQEKINLSTCIDFILSQLNIGYPLINYK